MSSYSELIKNFEKIRAYMREFYIYGFKSREEYEKKSSRSYDDERRRIESWRSYELCAHSGGQERVYFHRQPLHKAQSSL